MIKLWRKLTFGDEGSSTAERVVNVLAVIITAPEKEKQAKLRYVQSKCKHIWIVGRISACLFCQYPMPEPRLSWENASPRPRTQS